MASDKDFAQYVCEQAGLAGRTSTKRMFGEYALYLDAKVVAFICDNQVFVKPTDAGRELLGSVTEAPPYPGAKLYFQVNEHLDDQSLFKTLLITTADALPVAKPKKAKKSKTPETTTKAKVKSKAAKKTRSKAQAKGAATTKKKNA